MGVGINKSGVFVWVAPSTVTGTVDVKVDGDITPDEVRDLIAQLEGALTTLESTNGERPLAGQQDKKVE